jgi:hypothetical protein
MTAGAGAAGNPQLPIVFPNCQAAGGARSRD